MKKIIFVSTLNPQSHVSRYLINSLRRIDSIFEILFIHEREKIIDFDNNNTIGTFKKGNFSIFQIIKILFRQKDAIVHFQHEINMYGGMISSFLFPLMIIFVRLNNLKVITTIHAFINSNTFTKEFIDDMSPRLKLLPIPLVKFFFNSLMKTICFFSNHIIVHSNFIKKSISNELKISNNKITVSFLGCSNNKNIYIPKNYFFHFGYITKRKDFEGLIEDFNKFNTKNNYKYKLIISGKPIHGHEEYFKYLNTKYKSEHVLFLGFIDRKKFEYYFKYCLSIVLPDKYSIAGSGPLAMAYSFNKVSLVKNVGNFSKVIKNNVNGFKVNNSWGKYFSHLSVKKNVIQMQNKICEYKKNYTWDKAAELHKKLYLKFSDYS